MKNRKFWLAVGAAALFTTMRVMDFIDQTIYASMMTPTVIAYLAANVVAKKVANGKP